MFNTASRLKRLFQAPLPVRHPLALAASGVLAFALGAAAPYDSADAARAAKLGAIYNISFSGLTFAKGTLSLDVRGRRYSARVGMRTSGLVGLFVATKSNAESKGFLSGTHVVPSKYSMIAQEGDIASRVSMDMGRGNVRDLAVSPPLKQREDRVPVTSRHHHGVVDPLSAALMPVAKPSDAPTARACKRRLPIFDGWTRYDVQLSYRRTEQVSGRGYDGPVVVCGARWIPVAGHRAAKRSVQYMADNKNIEIWLAPIPGEPLLVPYRISLRTMNGDLVVEARKLDIQGDERKQAAR